MNDPRFAITAEGVRAWAAMFDVPLTEAERAALATQLAGGFAGIAALWQVDVTGMEPAVTFPVDRS